MYIGLRVWRVEVVGCKLRRTTSRAACTSSVCFFLGTKPAPLLSKRSLLTVRLELGA